MAQTHKASYPPPPPAPPAEASTQQTHPPRADAAGDDDDDDGHGLHGHGYTGDARASHAHGSDPNPALTQKQQQESPPQHSAGTFSQQETQKSVGIGRWLTRSRVWRRIKTDFGEKLKIFNVCRFLEL